MRGLLARSLALSSIAFVALGLTAQTKRNVTVHEWGTFTTVAGPDGRVIEWLPLGGPADLPCFVHVIPEQALLQLVGKVAGVQVRGGLIVQVSNTSMLTVAANQIAASGNPILRMAAAAAQTAKTIVPSAPAPNPFAVAGSELNYEQARALLRGTVRMETPVIYFYSPREERMNVSVNFPQGLVTEWYPPALVSQPPVKDTLLRVNLQSSIHWANVTLLPNTKPAFLREKDPSHYYPARETDAAPLRVGSADEKFLFYRGVGGFQTPLTAVEDEDGSILVNNIGKSTIPALVYFENRRGKVGYRISGAMQKSTRFEPVQLNGSVTALHRELEKLLVASGLYQREASAMVKTWEDSWFEEGARVFYILPAATVDEILPLTITPAPTKVARAFVGRMEVFTSETLNTVADALANRDTAVLQTYGRFLSPITEQLIAARVLKDPAGAREFMSAAYNAYVTRGSNRCQ